MVVVVADIVITQSSCSIKLEIPRPGGVTAEHLYPGIRKRQHGVVLKLYYVGCGYKIYSLFQYSDHLYINDTSDVRKIGIIFQLRY